MIEWQDDVWDRVDEAVAGFERDCAAGKDTPLLAFLPPETDPAKPLVLRQLIKVDQEYRWSKGQRPLVEDYLHDWPELADDQQWLVELLEHECRIRSQAGQFPNREELANRFPALHDAIDLSRIAREEAAVDRPMVGTVQASLLESLTTGRGAQHVRSRHAPLPPGTRLGRYSILGVLGKGGMGTVYLARDEELHRTVAIKILHRWAVRDEEQDARLLEEARTAAQLKHPGIVPVHDVGRRDDGTCFLVMEYVEGHSLGELISRGEIDIDVALKWTTELAEALDYAHRRGFVHRDIKPANVIIDHTGRARITDFGLALRQELLVGRVVDFTGTPPYMAPEQVNAESEKIDGRTDLWAVGAVFYEMLTGKRPFPGEEVHEICQSVLTREPDPPRSINRRVSRRLQQICLKCLAKDPEQRFASAGKLAKELQRFRHAAQMSPALMLVMVVVFLMLSGGVLWRAKMGSFGRPHVEQVGGQQNALMGLSGAAPSAERDWAKLPEHPVIPWLSDCKLVLTASTGGVVDMEQASRLRSGIILRAFTPYFIRPDPYRQEEFVLEQREDWLLWELPLSVGERASRTNAEVIPVDFDLRLRVGLHQDGFIQLGTLGDRPEDHLAVLTDSAGITNCYEFGMNVPLDQEVYGTPHTQWTDLGSRQTLLAAWCDSFYESLRADDAVVNGPPDRHAFYECPIRLKNFFDRPITVIRGAIVHQQFDFPHYIPDQRPLDEAANARWSPIAKQPDQDAQLVFRCDLKCTPNVPSALRVCAYADNNNGAAFRVYGLSLEDLAVERIESELASVTFDLQRNICSGRNSLDDASGATALLYDQAPTRIDLEAFSTWSVVYPRFRYVTLGSVEVLDCQSLPEGQSLQKIEPQIWVIPPEEMPSGTSS